MPTPEQINTNKAEWYQAIGELAVAFEHAVMGARQIALILLSAGVAPSASSVAQEMHVTLLSQVQARALANAVRAMLLRADRQSDPARTALDRFEKLIEVRNQIIHSTWFIGWASPDPEAPWEPERVSGFGPNRRLKGSAWSAPQLELSTVRASTAEAWALHREFLGVGAALLMS